MPSIGGLDPALIAELEVLITKLAHKASNFTPREHELMEMLKRNRDVILPQLRALTEMHKGANSAGREKLENLVEGIERICGRSSR